MIRSKSRKHHNKDISLKAKSPNIVTSRKPQVFPDFCMPKNTAQIYESSGSQSSQHNNNNNNHNINKKSKSSRAKEEYVPFTANPERRKNSLNTARKRILPVKSDSSMEEPNSVIRQPYEQNRPKTAATSQRKKNVNRNDGSFIIKDKDNTEKDYVISEETDADNCFQIIKDAIEEVIQNSLKKMLGAQLPVIHQKLEEIFNYIQKNEEDIANCFKDLEAKITHYGEDQARHIRYLCMKLEFDKLLHNHLGNLMVTSSAHSRCCHNNPVPKSCTSCLSHRQQYHHPQQQQQQPQNSCSCCFDNNRRVSTEHTGPMPDSMRCNSARPSTLRNTNHNNNYDQRPLTSVRCDVTMDSTSESQKKNTINNLHQCGDGHQQQDLNNKSVLSILEELKKRNSSELKTSSLLRTNITQNNSDDFNSLYNTQNLSSDNAADIGLKDILATIQKYYPIVDKSLNESNNHNRIDMELELDKDVDTHRSFDE